MAIIQNRLIGNDRVYRNIQAGTGQRRETHERGKQRKPKDEGSDANPGEGKLRLRMH